MKNSILVVCAILAGVIGFGPRVVTEHHIDQPAITAHEYLISEDSITGIVAGTEKSIQWYQQPGERTRYALVYLHGFSSSHQDLAPVPQMVAQQLEANLLLTRLKGHGLDADAMAKPQPQDWLTDAAEACYVAKQLGDRVILMGTSTGGTLAAWLGSQKWCAASIEAIVLVSPNFGPADTNSELLLLPWGEYLARMVVGEYREFKPHNAQQAQYWTEKYHSRSLVTMMGVVETTRHQMTDVEVPVLTIYSPQDRVVDVKQIQSHVERLSNRANRMVSFAASTDPMQHVLGGDILSPSSSQQLTEVMLEYILLLDGEE
ncbi:alpha/beta hydrolase [Vibrio sp. WXL210]|uniref:alpha/beta hydrolase n=1 Tax=Vibrio sp. WXL210 TaxID=3450709 RepID=UPI003EC73BF4